jgi:hypothetical protein
MFISTFTFGSRRVLAAALAFTALALAGCGGSSSSSTVNPPTDNPPASLQGTWGGGTSEAPASLILTTTGGSLGFACGAVDILIQPLTAGSNGAFDVVATEQLPLEAPVNGVYPQIHLVGTVSGSTITLHEVYASGTGPTYTLTYGKPAPVFNGPCPV